jgi:hypothetical protein
MFKRVLMLFISMGFILFDQSTQAAKSTGAAKCKKSTVLDKAARDYMLNNGMINDDEEIYWPNIKQGQRWQLVRTIVVKDKGCALVMRLTDYPKPLDQGKLEVLGLVQGNVVLFEKMMGLNPETDQIQIVSAQVFES